MDVDRVRLEEKRIVPSNTFYCRRDEHPVYFEMTLTRDYAGLTSASFSPINKDVILDACLSYAINDQEATVFNNIRYQKSYVKEKLTAGQVRSLDLRPLWQAVRAESVWRWHLMIFYEGSPCILTVTDICKDYLAMLEKTKFADITFAIQGEEIKAHKSVLAARSPYFRNMFDANMVENASGKIEVPDADSKAFRGMLEYIYGGMHPKNLDEISIDLFVIADKYDIPKLRDICEWNIRANLNVDSVVDALLLAHRHNLGKLMEEAKATAVASREVLMQSEKDRQRLIAEPDLLLKIALGL